MSALSAQGRNAVAAVKHTATTPQGNELHQSQHKAVSQQQSKIDRAQLEALRQLRHNQQLAALQAASSNKRSAPKGSPAAQGAGANARAAGQQHHLQQAAPVHVPSPRGLHAARPHAQQQSTSQGPAVKAANGSYAARARACSPARHSLGGDAPNLATAARTRTSSGGGAMERARSSSPARRSSLGAEGLFPAGTSLRNSLGGGSYAAQARGSSPLRRSLGSDVPLSASLSARCRSASPATARGRRTTASSSPRLVSHQPGSSSSDKHKQRQPRQQPSSSAAPANAQQGAKKVGEYERPWRQNMKALSHRTPSPARAHATAAPVAAVSTPAAAAEAPAAADGAAVTAAAAEAMHLLSADAAVPGQPYVLKSKRRTAEEHAALQVGQCCCLSQRLACVLCASAYASFHCRTTQHAQVLHAHLQQHRC